MLSVGSLDYYVGLARLRDDKYKEFIMQRPPTISNLRKEDQKFA